MTVAFDIPPLTLGALRIACAAALCLAASVTAVGCLPGMQRGRAAAQRTCICAATVAIGVGVWAEQFIAPISVPGLSAIGFSPTGAFASLAASLVSVAVGFALFSRYLDGRGWLGGGSVMGGGIALAHGLVLVAMRGPVEIVRDDVLVTGSVAAASGLCVCALFVARRWLGAGGRLAAAVLIAAAAVGSQAMAAAAPSVSAASIVAGAAEAALPAQALGFFAVKLITAAVLGARLMAQGVGALRTPAPAVRPTPAAWSTVALD
ncbi:MAG: hypothetical protein ACHP84_01890 [Caulobacterales bacterium]